MACREEALKDREDGNIIRPEHTVFKQFLHVAFCRATLNTMMVSHFFLGQ